MADIAQVEPMSWTEVATHAATGLACACGVALIGWLVQEYSILPSVDQMRASHALPERQTCTVPMFLSDEWQRLKGYLVGL